MTTRSTAEGRESSTTTSTPWKTHGDIRLLFLGSLILVATWKLQDANKQKLHSVSSVKNLVEKIRARAKEKEVKHSPPLKAPMRSWTAHATMDNRYKILHCSCIPCISQRNKKMMIEIWENNLLTFCNPCWCQFQNHNCWTSWHFRRVCQNDT